jgi:hypothetical protein
MPRDLLTSTVGVTQQRMARTSQAQSKLNQLISTGGTVEEYQDLQGISVASYISAEADLGTLNVQKFMATTLQQRQNYMSAKVGQATDINQRLVSLLVSLGAPSMMDATQFAVQRDELMREMVGVLNSRFLGSALFSGAQTNVDAVDAAALTPLGADASVSTDYYRGGAGGMPIQVDALRTVDKFPVTAADDAFAKTLTALRMLKGVSDPSASDPRVQKALELASSAQNKDYPAIIFKTGEMGSRLNAALSENMERVISVEALLAKGNPDTVETFMRLETEKMISSMSLALLVSGIKAIDELTSQFK